MTWAISITLCCSSQPRLHLHCNLNYGASGNISVGLVERTMTHYVVARAAQCFGCRHWGRAGRNTLSSWRNLHRAKFFSLFSQQVSLQHSCGSARRICTVQKREDPKGTEHGALRNTTGQWDHWRGGITDYWKVLSKRRIQTSLMQFPRSQLIYQRHPMSNTDRISCQ